MLFPMFPSGGNANSLPLRFYDKVVLGAQGKEPTEVMRWLQRVDRGDCTFEELSCASCRPDYVSMDWKLAPALAWIVAGELKGLSPSNKEAVASPEMLVAG